MAEEKMFPVEVDVEVAGAFDIDDEEIGGCDCKYG